jgi:hypothetical protein
MTPQIQTEIWADITNDTNAAAWLLQWADCEGPLAHLPTADPAVQLVMNARRHLLARVRRQRQIVGAF